MSMRTLESEILRELRIVIKNSKFRLKDLLEWSTTEAVVDSGLGEAEVKVHLPEVGCWCAIAKEHDKR